MKKPRSGSPRQKSFNAQLTESWPTGLVDPLLARMANPLDNPLFGRSPDRADSLLSPGMTRPAGADGSVSPVAAGADRKQNDASAQEIARTTPLDLFTVAEAAAYMRVSKSYLDKLRVLGGGPPYLRLGKRRIVYRKADLDAWMSARRYDMTAQYEEKR